MKNSFDIYAGWLIDGSGESARQNILLRVTNGIIVSIKDSESTDLSRNDVIDLSHCTLLPGFVDAHVHLFMSGTKDPEVRQHQLDAPFEDMKKIISRHIHQQLAHGVVAVRDGGDYDGHALRYKKECLPAFGKAPHMSEISRQGLAGFRTLWQAHRKTTIRKKFPRAGHCP